MIKIEKNELQRIASASSAVAKKGAAQPAAEMAFLSIVDGSLIVKATDMENWLSVSLDVSGEIADVCVSAAKLSELANGISGELLKIDVVEGDLVIQGKGRRKLAGVTVPFPEPAVPDEKPVVFDTEALLGALADAAPTMSDDVLTRPHMAGVHIHSHDGRYYAAATNGSAFVAIGFADSLQDIAVTIPAAAIRHLKAAAGSETITCRFGERGNLFEWEGGSLLTKVVEGAFPPYRRIIPAHSDSFTVQADELVRAIKAVAVVAQDDKSSGAKRVELLLSRNGIVVSAASHQGTAEEPVEGEWSGADDLTLHFSSKRMIEAIGSYGDAVIEVGASSYAATIHETKPLLIKPVGSDDKFSILALMM